MSNFPALEVVIGLCFVYFVLSLICSAVTESIASLRGWRAAKLELGIKNLLSGSDTVTKEGEALAKQVYDHPLVQALIRPKTGTKPGKKPPWPSYIPSRTFISALMDIGAAASLGANAGRGTRPSSTSTCRRRSRRFRARRYSRRCSRSTTMRRAISSRSGETPSSGSTIRCSGSPAGTRDTSRSSSGWSARSSSCS